MTTFIFWFHHIILAIFLTYLVMGFIISFEVTAAMGDNDFAYTWLRKHFSYEEFYYSVIIFYPMIRLVYLFLEYIPSLFTHEIRCVFNLDSLFMDLFNYE